MVSSLSLSSLSPISLEVFQEGRRWQSQMSVIYCCCRFFERREGGDGKREEFVAQGRNKGCGGCCWDRKRVKEQNYHEGFWHPKIVGSDQPSCFPAQLSSIFYNSCERRTRRKKEKDTKGEMYFGAGIQLIQAYQRLANNER